VALGSNALFANTTGGYNVAIGTFALSANTTASNNTAVGYQADVS
jgi:trimeric autotransporter adhesin